MSQRNGDRARFQINRKRKIRHRQRVGALLTALVQRRERPASAAERGRPQMELRDERVEPNKTSRGVRGRANPSDQSQ
jgi:hypothetical protein